MLNWLFGNRPEPEPYDEVEEVEETPLAPLPVISWGRPEEWGYTKLLSATDSAILWQYGVTEKGIIFPRHRHESIRELILLVDGALKISEHDDCGDVLTEKLILTGDAYLVQPRSWHQIVAVKYSMFTVLHVPPKFDMRISTGDVEEWKPARPIGRG